MDPVQFVKWISFSLDRIVIICWNKLYDFSNLSWIACLVLTGLKYSSYSRGEEYSHCASDKFYWTTGDKNEVSYSCLDRVFELRTVCYMQHCKLFSHMFGYHDGLQFCIVMETINE